METMHTSIRRSYKQGDQEIPYGDGYETVKRQGKDVEVPCIKLETTVPSADSWEIFTNELLQNIGGEKNTKAFRDRIFGKEIATAARSPFLNMKDKDAEQNPEKRSEFIEASKRSASEFSFASVLAGTIPAKEALDEFAQLNALLVSGEIDAEELARRFQQTLGSVRGLAAK